MSGSVQWFDMLDMVEAYYGKGSDQWAKIAQYGITENTYPLVKNVPGVSVTMSKSGKILGWDYNNPFATVNNPVDVVNSNVQTGMYGTGSFTAKVPATANTNGTLTMMESGSKIASTGAKLATIADRASLALVGVSLGTKLGKLIDETIYNVNPEWWDEHYPTINPETWDDMVDNETGKNIIRTIFGLENDSATMYVDERMLPYTYMTLLQNGAYTATGVIIPPSDINEIYKDVVIESIVATQSEIYAYQKNNGEIKYYLGVDDNSSTVYVGSTLQGRGLNFYFVGASKSPFRLYRKYPSGVTEDFQEAVKATYNGEDYYWQELGGFYMGGYDGGASSIEISRIKQGQYYMNPNDCAPIWGACVLFGSIGGLNGVVTNPDAAINIVPDSLINPATGKPVTPKDNPSDVLQAMKTAYPQLFDGAIYEDVPQPDGSINRITYIPTPYPNTSNPTKPITDDTTGTDPQTNTQINPDTRTPELIQQLIDSLTGTPAGDTPTPPSPPDTGSGDTPSVIIPTGSANALYSIYNPTQAELNSFGAWLWSSNFVDQLLKLFNDPMQAIIGLHKVFVQPNVSGKSNIKVGYLDSGVNSNVVDEQYTTVDCGTVSIREYFGNVFDYDPFTQVYIYLPFIGIEKLDTGDVMRSSINVVYHIDVLTGACLAEILVTRDASGGTIYTFAGNCAVQYPISSGSYMGIVASLASVAGGVIGTIASGGAIAPVAMGAAAGVLNAHTRVQHSGSFSGNAGAMGIKKPYLIITRPQTCLASTFPALDGFPANKSTTISDCSGFVKCKSCHVENVPATDAELSEIESLLKSGIII